MTRTPEERERADAALGDMTLPVSNNNHLVLRTAGTMNDGYGIHVFSLQCACGDIEDGVGMQDAPDRGCWVVNSDDILRLATAIELHRARAAAGHPVLIAPKGEK